MGGCTAVLWIAFCNLKSAIRIQSKASIKKLWLCIANKVTKDLSAYESQFKLHLTVDVRSTLKLDTSQIGHTN